MHAILSSIAPCGLTQAIRAPGCVTLAKSYCSLYQGFAALYKCTPRTTRYSVVIVCETNKYCTFAVYEKYKLLHNGWFYGKRCGFQEN